MSITAFTDPHPLMRCVERVSAALDEAGNLEPAFLRTAEKAAALIELERQQAKLRALQLRVLAVAGDVAEETGARSTGAWLDAQVHLGRPAAARAEQLAAALDSRWKQVAAALGDGAMTEDQAEVVVRALQALPEDTPSEVVTRAEVHLVEQAQFFDPRQLRQLGRRVLEIVAPDVVDAEEHRLLLAEERRRAARPGSRSSSAVTARELRGVVPEQVGSRLRTYLEAISSRDAPRRSRGHRPGWWDRIGWARRSARCWSGCRRPISQHGAWRPR